MKGEWFLHESWTENLHLDNPVKSRTIIGRHENLVSPCLILLVLAGWHLVLWLIVRSANYHSSLHEKTSNCFFLSIWCQQKEQEKIEIIFPRTRQLSSFDTLYSFLWCWNFQGSFSWKLYSTIFNLLQYSLNGKFSNMFHISTAVLY